jgi:hypothetical protein
LRYFSTNGIRVRSREEPLEQGKARDRLRGGTAVWNDGNLLEIPLTSEGEARVAAIGVIGARHWTAIVTYRADRVRIISVRRARDEEIACYEG